MRARSLLFSLFLVTAKSHASFEAHEWGTFTSLVGSNGITQNGMYHEDEALPPFVHGFGETQPPVAHVPPADPPPAPAPVQPNPPPNRPCRFKSCFDREILSHNVVTQKMETPVIYFYATGGPRFQNVRVNVKFPQGVVTETYPAPTKTYPSLRDGLVLANGDTTFDVTIASNVKELLPDVSPNNIYSHARNVASNVVQSGNEMEKFIFYRGLGRFQPALSITSRFGALTVAGNEASMPQAAFLVHVDASGDTRMIDVSPFDNPNRVDVSARTIALLSNHGVTSGEVMGGQLIHLALFKALGNAGLLHDEAEAMIATWEHGYFHVPGLRLLYVLPRAEVDQALPLTMQPAPSRLTRVFVGRIEVLLDTEERRILANVMSQRDGFSVDGLGRFAEPMLRRVLEVYSSQNPTSDGLSLFNRLISRAATGSPASASIH